MAAKPTTSSVTQGVRAAASLVSFEETFNFPQFVKEQLVHSQSSEVAKVITKSAHVIGQERDGSILFSWDVLVANSPGKFVTKVGLYSNHRPSYQVLYTHEEVVHICGATVNADRTLLAFSTHEIVGPNVNYESYVSEILPQSRTLSLNLSSSDFRKVQFIYSSSQSSVARRPARSQSLQAHLLVIIPGHWICLYNFNLESVDRGVTIARQPKSDMLTENVPWYQWDPVNQWLYYARFESMPSASLAKSRSNRNSLVLCALSFEDTSEHTVLTVSLPLSHHTDYYLGSATYYDNPVAFSPPIHELNMTVLRNTEGLWCVCLQHPGKHASSPYLTRKKEPKAEKETEVHYSVYLLHSGHVMDARVTLPLPSSPSGQYHINFFLLHSCVVAYIPGVLFHLLNVGPRTDPCHHLILDHKYSPLLPSSTSSSDTTVSLSVVPDSGSSSTGSVLATTVSIDSLYAVMDTDSQIIYSCCLEPAGFLELFKDPTTSAEVQESLLHLITVSFRLHSEALKMLEHICQTPVSLSDPRLFAEFLKAFVYSCVVTDYKPYLVKQLPLTNSMTYRDGMYRNKETSKYVVLRCTEITGFVNQLLVQSDHRLVAISEDERLMFSFGRNDHFNQLCYFAYLNQPNVYERISLTEIYRQASSPKVLLNYFSSGAASAAIKKKRAAKKRQKASSPDHHARSGSIMGKLRLLINMPRVPNAAQNDETIDDLPFLLPDEDLYTEHSRRDAIIQDLIRNALGRSLRMRGNKTSSAHVEATTEGYWEELQRASLILLKVIWESLGFTMETHPLFCSIHRQVSPSEVVLFELLESYQMAHSEVGLPLPSGFHTLFISLGYLCLAPTVFLQYLRNGVFTPTVRFLHLLFTQCEEVDDHFLFEILSLLNDELMEIGMGMWKSPILGLFASRQC